VLISRFRFLLFPLGLGLFLTAIFFQGGMALNNSPNIQQESATASPTPDRLAEPTLSAAPSRADMGAQVYWLNCSACHGDRGQGLTDEFRQLYPPEDQNCWNSHCHGDVTYENGFTLPKVVPALIGPGALQKFGTAGNVFGFTKAVMPFQRPGALTDEEYYQIISFLLRENKLWTASEGVTASNAGEIRVGPPPATPMPQPAPATGINFYASFLIGFIILTLSIVMQRLFRKR
jgi:hypothetical protein